MQEMVTTNDLPALNNVYPEYDWPLERIRPITPRGSGYWSDKANQRAFFDEIARSLNFKKPEDWYSVTADIILQRGGSFIKTYYNGSYIAGKSFKYNWCNDVI
jgi:hypothetical protein